MSVYHPLFAVGALAVAVLTASAFAPLSQGSPKTYRSLDGLRGLLAMAVLIDHAAGWYAVVRGDDAATASTLYSHFGDSGVSMFFMITAFLFGSRLIDSRSRGVDWLRLYVSRVLRLVPLYLCFVGVLVALSLAAARFQLHQPPSVFAVNVLHWLGFTMAAMPQLNTLSTSVGSQAWSLPYEWWFYFGLPAMGVLVGARPMRLPLVAVSAAAMLAAAWWVTAHQGWLFAGMFLGGWLAVFLARQRRALEFSATPIASLVAIVALFAAVSTGPGVSLVMAALLTIAFVITACGNTLLGVLTSRPFRTLGEMAYSVYLLHTIALYVAFRALGTRAAQLTPLQHWLVVFVVIAGVVTICRWTFVSIEAPAMAAVDAATRRLRNGGSHESRSSADGLPGDPRRADVDRRASAGEP